METQQAPAVRTRAKSRWNPSAVDHAIIQGLRSARGIPQAMACMHEGEVVGMVKGDHDYSHSYFQPMTHKKWCGFTGYDDLDNETKNGKYIGIKWSKTVSTWAFSFSWADCWPCGGNLPAGDYSGTANTARQLNASTTGGLNLKTLTPSGGDTRHLIDWSCEVSGANLGRNLILYDRVLAYDNSSTSSTVINFTNTLPAQRYISTGREGLLISVSAAATTGATSGLSLTSTVITDQAGNTGVTLVPGYTQQWDFNAQAPSSTMPATVVVPVDNAFQTTMSPFLGMGAGISGCRKLESTQSSGSNTGAITWALCKPVATLWGFSGVSTRVNLARTTFALERIYDDSCLSFMFIQGSTNTGDIMGKIGVAHG